MRLRRIEPLVSTIAHETVALPFPPAAEFSNSPAGMLVQTVQGCLNDAKAEDIVCIDLNGKTALADTMIIATGRSNTHVGAMAERVIKALKELGVAAPRVEGLANCDWVLVDAGDAVVHLFRPEIRAYYNLEKMWGATLPSAETAAGQ